MNIRILFAGTALCTVAIAMAQQGRLSAGIELGFPIGDLKEVAGRGIGMTLGCELRAGDHLGLIVRAGYMGFKAKGYYVHTGIGNLVRVEGDAIGLFPAQAGLKYYFTDDQGGFYVGLLAGMHLMRTKGPKVDPNTGFLRGEEDETRTDLSLAVPEVGCIIGEHIDIALRYQMIFDTRNTLVAWDISGGSTIESKAVTDPYIGVRAAYLFGHH